jgi:hypothetical protein
MYGKKSWGIVRSTFLIDGGGTVRKVWRKVNVDGHDEAVIAAVKELASEAVGAARAKPQATSPSAKKGSTGKNKKTPAKKKPPAK